jgi:hypothetical protein
LWPPPITITSYLCAGDGGIGIEEALVIDELSQVVAAGKSRYQFVLVLPNAMWQIAGDTHIEDGGLGAIRHDVDEELFGWAHPLSVTAIRLRLSVTDEHGELMRRRSLAPLEKTRGFGMTPSMTGLRRIIRFRANFSEVTLLPIGTAFHERTFPLCQSLNYREWSGYYTVSVYEVHHEHEYNAIRNAAALIDISPLYKYLITGKDATRLVNRVITRDINKVKVGQVIYCCWCDEEGKVIDDGTISRLEENVYRWTAADPSLRWFRQNGLNMDVQVEDISEKLRRWRCRGRLRRSC